MNSDLAMCLLCLAVLEVTFGVLYGLVPALLLFGGIAALFYIRIKFF